MNVSSLKVNKIARIMALTLVLGVSSVAMSADALTDQQIFDRIQTNNAGQMAVKGSLNFVPVRRATYEGDTIKEASTRNLGHLLIDLRTQFSNELNWINELQDKGRNFESDFVTAVVSQALGAFDWVYGTATADARGDNLVTNKEKVALQTWLARTLIDYGVTAESYRQIYVSKKAELDSENGVNEKTLSDKLASDREQKNVDLVAKNAEYDDKRKELEGQKANLERVVANESNASRKEITAGSIKELDKSLDKLSQEKAAYNASVDAEVAVLEAEFNKAVAKNKSDADAELKKLTDMYAYIFESLGTSGGKTVLRWFSGHATVRSDYTEFSQLDKMLSNEYPALPGLARNLVLDTLFGLISPQNADDVTNTLRKTNVIKKLLGISDADYGEITKRVHANELTKKRQLAAKAQESGDQMKSAIADVSSVPPALSVQPEVPAATPAETAAASSVADRVAAALDQKKKDVNNGTAGSASSCVSASALAGGSRLADTSTDETLGLRNRANAGSASAQYSGSADATAFSSARTPVTVWGGNSRSSYQATSGAQKKNGGKKRHG